MELPNLIAGSKGLFMVFFPSPSKILHFLFSYFLPSACLSCRSVLEFGESGPFCAECVGKLKPIVSPVCTLCGDPSENHEIPSHVCGDCLEQSPPFEWARSVLELEPVLAQAIYALKYQGSESGLSWFSEKMKAALAENEIGVQFDLIVPIPLHPFRLIRRGYNQSLLLARGLETLLRVPVEIKNLVKKDYKKPQALGTREERLRQIRGSFSVKNPKVFCDKKILLIDDVYTTGATVRECAKVIKNAGGQVYVLTLARTPLLHP